MRRFKPGQSVRSKATCTVEDVLTDPNSPTVTIFFPDGTTFSASPVRDSVGKWHADFLIPATMHEGVGVQRWQVVAVPIVGNACKERRFIVERLAA